MTHSKRIFNGMLVIDFSTTVAGPGATMALADYGADVIRVESMSHPDSIRTSAPFKGKPGDVNHSGYFTTYNASKYSIALNMRLPGGLDVAKRLCERADIVIDGYRPGVMAKWGLGFDVLTKVNPGLIMLSTTMLGQNGPASQFVGYGTEAQGLAGWGELIGYPDRPPMGPFGAYTDMISARYIGIAIVAALEYRRRTGKGQYIDQSHVESSTSFESPLILDYAANKRLAERNSNRDPNAAPHGAFRCKGDDRWCVIAVFSDEDWTNFRAAIGSPSWTNQAEFSTLAERKRNENELERLVESWTINHSPEEVTEILQKHNVGSGVVQNVEDMFNDPQLQHRGHFTWLQHSEIGRQAYESFGFRLAKVQGFPEMPSPGLGEHTEQVCKEVLGMSDEEFIRLLSAGVFE